MEENPRAYLEQFLITLQCESKPARKQALVKINYEIFENPTNTNVDIKEVFSAVYAHVLKSFSDESEGCREVSAEIISSFLDKLPLNDYYLTYIMPVIVRRIGCPEIVEESEELRLILIILVKKIINKYKETNLLNAFFNDFTLILCKTATDPFPKVKIEACETIILLSNVLKHNFHMQSDSYVKPVISNFVHQHFRVRVTAVKCIGAIVMNGNAKCFEQSITPLAEKLFDENVQVRHQIIMEIGRWMLELRDRYSFWHKMIPLLLTGLSDAIEIVRETATKLWDDIGKQYMEENEDDLKKRSDFLNDDPKHYPNDVKRPNLGCRTLVQRNISKIVPAISREMDGWQADPRLRVTQLLCWLLLCAEEGCTQHTNIIVLTMLRGAKDDDQRVILEVKRAAELFGYFIAPDIWWPLLEADMEQWSTLIVLANIIKGTNAEWMKENYLKEICEQLSEADNCQTRKQKYQVNLLLTLESLLNKCGTECKIVSEDLFTAAFTVRAMAETEEISFKAYLLLDQMRRTLEYGSNMVDLYNEHLHTILARITSEAVTWTMSTPDRCLLECALDNGGWALSKSLHLVAPLLRECLATQQVDPEVKLRMFTTLSKLMLEKKKCFTKCDRDKLEAFMRILLLEIIVPNLVWAPGRTAEAIRISAICCLCSVLENPNTESKPDDIKINEEDETSQEFDLFPSKESFSHFLESVAPQIIALVDDNSNVTRQYSVRAICYLARVAKRKECFNEDMLHKMYYVVLKRLDDGHSKVRLMSVQALCILFRLRPKDYNLSLYRAHVDGLYAALLIHLDDSDDEFRKDMFDALLKLSDVDPTLLLRKLKANIQLYRNKSAYERLIDYIEKVKIK